MKQKGLDFRIQVLWKGMVVLVQIEKSVMTRCHKWVNMGLPAVVS